MLGWLRNRVRRENIKLLKQNELAAAYLAKTQESFIAGGLSADRELVATLKFVGFTARTYLSDLETYREMPTDRFNEQFKANKDLRRMYDEVLTDQAAFARQFGSARDRIESFDRKFQPNEGWKRYFEHFPKSTEQIFRGY